VGEMFHVEHFGDAGGVGMFHVEQLGEGLVAQECSTWNIFGGGGATKISTLGDGNR
jgi:hypothetical protein